MLLFSLFWLDLSFKQMWYRTSRIVNMIYFFHRYNFQRAWFVRCSCYSDWYIVVAAITGRKYLKYHSLSKNLIFYSILLFTDRILIEYSNTVTSMQPRAAKRCLNFSFPQILFLFCIYLKVLAQPHHSQKSVVEIAAEEARRLKVFRSLQSGALPQSPQKKFAGENCILDTHCLSGECVVSSDNHENKHTNESEASLCTCAKHVHCSNFQNKDEHKKTICVNKRCVLFKKFGESCEHDFECLSNECLDKDICSCVQNSDCGTSNISFSMLCITTTTTSKEVTETNFKKSCVAHGRDVASLPTSQEPENQKKNTKFNSDVTLFENVFWNLNRMIKIVWSVFKKWILSFVKLSANNSVFDPFSFFSIWIT